MIGKVDRQLQRRTHSMEKSFCFRNFKLYLKETTLHGLRFVGDERLTVWERFFFLCAFIGAVFATIHLVVYIYAKWDSTPVIIGVNPFPVSISDIPFPAITLCNTNQLLRSKVAKYNATSPEQALMDMACFQEGFDPEKEPPDHYKYNNLSLLKFIYEHAQPCSQLIKSCILSAVRYPCSDLFRTEITDEGKCCVFNLMPPKFRHVKNYKLLDDYTNISGAVPVNWTPERGYPKHRPENFYPRTARGIGVTMGLTLILNAEVDEYYCVSTNGPGFKIALHNPMEAPRVHDIGLTIGVGEEIRLRMEAHSTESTASIRSLRPRTRNCLFGDETRDLKIYKYYTRENCENECQAMYLHRKCECIPYNLPLVIENATVCGAPHVVCANNAQNSWLRARLGHCRASCYSPCFDLTYGSTAFRAPLAEGSYLVQDDVILRNMSREYLRQNVAIVHFYYREFVFHGYVRNVYVGFTEFLSNTGGILGLFLGFSFISLAEALYYAFIRPIFWWKRPIGTKVENVPAPITREAVGKVVNIKKSNFYFQPQYPSPHWLGREIYRPRRSYILRTSTLTDFLDEPKKQVVLQTTGAPKYNKELGFKKNPWV